MFSYYQDAMRCENELANLVFGMRTRFDRRVGTYWPANPLPDPVVALESGTSWRSIVNSNVHGVLRQVVREAIGGMLRAEMPDRLGLTWFGQHDAHWIAYYQVHHQILGARPSSADLAQLELWATLARSCGWWWPRDDVCVVSERPSLIRTEPLDEGVRLHAETGKAIEFPDGWGTSRIRSSWRSPCSRTPLRPISCTRNMVEVASRRAGGWCAGNGNAPPSSPAGVHRCWSVPAARAGGRVRRGLMVSD